MDATFSRLAKDGRDGSVTLETLGSRIRQMAAIASAMHLSESAQQQGGRWTADAHTTRETRQPLSHAVDGQVHGSRWD